VLEDRSFGLTYEERSIVFQQTRCQPDTIPALGLEPHLLGYEPP
jgi:hypothetical protein